MKLLILTTVLSLSGCLYQSINLDDLAAANKKCAEVDATVVNIVSHFTGNETVDCSNRRTYSF